jgi:hypothetical protein
MTLTLSTCPSQDGGERSLVPACLQTRAPLSYEVLNEHKRRLHPTLAGYKLRWGKNYFLRVHTQEGETNSWSLRLLAPRSVVEPTEKDEIDDDARLISFETKSPSLGDHWKWFSHVTSFPVRLDFTDGRAPYQFTIPVILRASRSRWIVYFLVTALVSYLSQAWYQESITLPSTEHIVWTGAIWLGLVLCSVLWDQWKFYREAIRHLRESAKTPTMKTSSY